MQATRLRHAAVSALAVVLFGWSAHVRAATAAEPTVPGEELLLFQEIPSVFSASKYEQKVTEAPSAVSIVTAEEIKKYGYRTLADILRSLRSFHITYDRIYHQAGVRGFNRPGDTNSRFLLLVDGLRLNDSIFNAASIDTLFIVDVDLIDRVEIIRGPSSSLYGTSAFFGVINVITKRGRDLKGVEISGEAGSHETYDGRLSYGNRFGTGLEMLLSGTGYESEGDNKLHFEEFTANNGIARNVDDDEVYNLLGKFSFGDFTLEGMYVDKEKRLPTAPYETEFNDPRNKVDVEQWVSQLKYERHLKNRGDVLARVGYNYYSSEGDYVYGPSPFSVINTDEFRGEWWNGEVQFGKQLGERHRLVLGGEYQNQSRQDQKNFDLEVSSGAKMVNLDVKKDSENWGLFIQDEFQILKNLILNLGVRHDEYDTFGGTTNPRIALIFSPQEKATLKLLYGEAFRAPNAFELYYHDGPAFQKPNPDLEPENIKTYELVWEQFFGDQILATIAGFYYDIDDLINITEDPSDPNPLGDPKLVFRNVDEVEAKGLELELEGRLTKRLEGRFSYTFQEVKDGETDKLLFNAPKHLAKINLIVPVFRNHILLGIEEQYTSKRLTRSREETGGYAVTNLTLFSQRLVEGLEASASVYNLFDKKFSDTASFAHTPDTIEQDGRIFRVKITYIF
jgi:iron complex outermembrane receptor protein